MKKIWNKFICTAIIITLIATFNVVLAASPNGNLLNFKSVKKLVSSTFSDVPQDAWFFKGVKNTYENSIMDGIGGGKFDPSGQVTKAQAIAIAARVHAIYYGNTIKDTNSSFWYAKYYDYAKSNNLLHSSITNIDNLDEDLATRSDIAYLFNNVLSQSDLSIINSSPIPDISKINTDYKSAVKLMYSAGIITGKEGGNFDPDGLATRAEISTIIMRLTDKLERIAYDSKYNYDMENQESNFANNGLIAYDKNNLYCVTYSDSFYKIDKKELQTGIITTIYKANLSNTCEIEKLALNNNNLYFIQVIRDAQGYRTSSILKKINLHTLEISNIYQNNCINLYVIYGNEIFVQNSIISSSYGFSYEIGKVSSITSISKIAKDNGMIYSMNIFDNKLYFSTFYKLYQIDLTNNSINLCSSDVTCLYTTDKNIIYYADTEGNIYKALINNLSQTKLLATIDVKTRGHISYLNINKNKLYFSPASEWGVSCVPSYTLTDNSICCGYTTTVASHLAIFDDNIFYCKYSPPSPQFLRIADKNVNKENDIPFIEWLKNKPLNRSTNGPLLLPTVKKENTSVLTSKEIFSQCSPAVFYIECFDKNHMLISSGSGFFINPNGIAITNNHVIKNATSYKIKLTNGKQYDVERVVAIDASKDIAIIKIAGSGFDYLSIGDSSKITGGDKVYAIGNPMGLTNSITDGMISNSERDIGIGITLFQISNPVSPGSSGGALINEYGEAIGITFLSLTSGQNLNFAIPINYIFTIDLDKNK